MNYSWLYKNGVIAVIVGLFFSVGAVDRYTKIIQVPPIPMEQQVINAYSQGEAFFSGQGVPRNYARARECFAFVIRNNQALNAELRLKTFFMLGEIALSGDAEHGVVKDYKMVAHCFETVLDRHFASIVPAVSRAYAMQHLAEIYFYGGNGLTANYRKALYYLNLALSNDHVSLAIKSKLFYLQGAIYMIGGGGVEKNFDTAKKCFWWPCHYSNLFPHCTALANLALGQIYLSGGHGVERNCLRARKCFIEASKISSSEQDDKSVFSQAHYYLGFISYMGLCGQKDYQEARNKFKEVVKEDSGLISSLKVQAYFYLGVILFEGGYPNVRSDYKKATESFSAVLNTSQGLPNNVLRAKAYCYRGLIYADGGRGVRQDIKQAREDMKQALSYEVLPQQLKDEAQSVLVIIEENEQAQTGDRVERTSKRLRKK